MAAINGRRRLMLEMDCSNLMDRVETINSDEWDPMDVDVITVGSGFSGFLDIVPRLPTEQETSQYIEKNKDREGFDYDEVKSLRGIATPVDLDQYPLFSKDANTLSQMAIHLYNKQNGTSYWFVKVLNLYTQLVAGFNHYITFVALDENNVGETFQALGSKLMPNATRPDGLTVKYCKVKGT